MVVPLPKVSAFPNANLMVAPLLGDEEVQREEAQEDSNGCESRWSKELGTEGKGVIKLQGFGSPHFPGLGIQAYASVSGFLYRSWGSALGSSCLLSKHFVCSLSLFLLNDYLLK